MKFLSAKELFEIAKRRIYALRPDLDPDLVDVKGGDLNLLVACCAGAGEVVSRQNIEAFESLLFRLAKGQSLDLLAYDRYGLLRKPANAAVGSLRFTRPTDSYGAFPIPQGTRVTAPAPFQGVTCETTESAAFGESSTGPVDVPAVMKIDGIKGNVASGLMTRLVENLEDDTVVVTNPAKFAGGDPIQSDSQFLEAIIAHRRSLTKGTLDAIRVGALTVPGISQATPYEVTEIVDGSPQPYGTVDLFIGDGTGTGNQTLADLVLTVLDEWRPAGGYTRPVAGTQLIVEIRVNPSYTGPGATSVKQELVRKSIMAHVNAGIAEQKLTIALIAKAVGAINGIVLEEGWLEEPVGDVIPGAGQTIRTYAGNIKVNGV